MEKQTTENETLNAKLRNKVTPLVTLLDILDAIDNVTIKFNNIETKEDDRELFRKYNIGNKVQVTEYWYPRHKIIIK